MVRELSIGIFFTHPDLVHLQVLYETRAIEKRDSLMAAYPTAYIPEIQDEMLLECIRSEIICEELEKDLVNNGLLGEGADRPKTQERLKAERENRRSLWDKLLMSVKDVKANATRDEPGRDFFGLGRQAYAEDDDD